MICEHLSRLEAAIIQAGVKEMFRGRPWSEGCRVWVYFDCYLPTAALRESFDLAACVEDRRHFGTHDGQECGFVCSIHGDGLMGYHPDSAILAKRFDPK